MFDLRHVHPPSAGVRTPAANPLSYVPIARSILIVSGDPALRKLLCTVLGRHRYHTHQLADASLLTVELRARKIDLLIIDLDLGEQQSVERLVALPSTFPGLRMIALTAIPEPNLTGFTVLSKPFRRELLLESVQNAFVDAADAHSAREPAPAPSE